MKNKKQFCLFVTYPTVVTLRKPSRPHVVVSRTWIRPGHAHGYSEQKTAVTEILRTARHNLTMENRESHQTVG